MSIINIVFGTMFEIYGIALIVIWYLAYQRKKNMDKTCTACTTGKVIRYSNNGNINLPLVQYQVDGKSYKVVGPKFRGYVNVNTPSLKQGIESEVTSNLTTREDLPDIIKIHRKSNAFVSVSKNPLAQLYPVGSDAPVYYDPANPKRAFVQRFIAPSKFFLYALFLGIVFIIAGIVIFLLKF